MFVCFMMLLISLQVSADNDAEPPVDFSSTDEQTLTVTTRSMRNALWYYENYFIQRDLSESQAGVIAGLDNLVTEWEEAFYLEAEKVAVATNTVTRWRVIGVTTGLFVIALLILEFIDAYQTANTGA